jgi:hypothetical protein
MLERVGKAVDYIRPKPDCQIFCKMMCYVLEAQSHQITCFLLFLSPLFSEVLGSYFINSLELTLEEKEPFFFFILGTLSSSQ